MRRQRQSHLQIQAVIQIHHVLHVPLRGQRQAELARRPHRDRRGQAAVPHVGAVYDDWSVGLLLHILHGCLHGSKVRRAAI